jgi:hypothetical protein
MEGVCRGFRWEGDDPDQLREVVEAAFDYRGDVTLLLRGGGELEGYLSNRETGAPEPFVEVFPAKGGGKRRVLFRELRGLAFSGKDTASGKSWETWVKKWKAKKEAEARGEKVADIGLFPEELD